MKSNSFFQDLQRNLSDLIHKSPAGDVEKNVKSFLSQGFSKLDLVTREEFEEQVFLVNRLRERVVALEDKVAKLVGSASQQQSTAATHSVSQNPQVNSATASVDAPTTANSANAATTAQGTGTSHNQAQADQDNHSSTSL
ncbi:accessory factor UbiK family protein [Brackiella oedipodis]|uniref:accessory factor UbiK family protein n=1 Tax=Brackiella oedipodis TaxID=124225 RepID=UPI000A00FF25